MTTMADYFVSAVRYESDGTGIEKLRVHENKGNKAGSSVAWDRKSVVEHIEDHKDSFCTIQKGSNGNWVKGEDIHVIEVKGVQYLRTDGNRTAADNLGSLPEF